MKKICNKCDNKKDANADFYDTRNTCKKCKCEYAMKRSQNTSHTDKRTYKRKNYREFPVRYLLYRAKDRAKIANVPFNITKKDIVIPTHCPVLGIPLEISSGSGGSDYSPALDRIIPQLGYVPGNIIVISKKANQIKNNGNAEEIGKVYDWLRGLTK
jgi:hypothetical protein